jgi:hypothetical protein
MLQMGGVLETDVKIIGCVVIPRALEPEKFSLQARYTFRTEIPSAPDRTGALD